MKKYNLSQIMKKAWQIFRKTGKTFSESLKLAWRNAKVIKEAQAAVNEETHTWYAWKEKGFEVIHESKAIFKVSVYDPKTKSGSRILSYFGSSQVQPIEA